MSMWLDVRELSLHLKIKEKTIYYLVARRAIPHYRVGKLVRFKQSEIDEWMESKRAKLLKEHVDKIVRSVYTGRGRPDRLGKEVANAL